jgi:hypothetical protein
MFRLKNVQPLIVQKSENCSKFENVQFLKKKMKNIQFWKMFKFQKMFRFEKNVQILKIKELENIQICFFVTLFLLDLPFLFLCVYWIWFLKGVVL